MNEETRKEVFQRLDALAQKLNVTGEHLWDVLVAQAEIVLYEHLMWLGLGILLLAISMTTATKIHRYLTGQARSYDGYEGWWGLQLMPFAVFLLGITMTIHNVGAILTPLLNPEYWALLQVMRIIQ